MTFKNSLFLISENSKFNNLNLWRESILETSICVNNCGSSKTRDDNPPDEKLLVTYLFLVICIIMHYA
jgi:hypothetical protein